MRQYTLVTPKDTDVINRYTHKNTIFFILLGLLIASSILLEASLVTVEGGTLPNKFRDQRVSPKSFQINSLETTWGEWKTVYRWATAHGYDFSGTGEGVTDGYPVYNVSWLDVVKWCNAKSEMDGLNPVYWVNTQPYKTGEVSPVWNVSSNGYRLPTVEEVVWAGSGGNQSKGYRYSGGDDLNEVAWYKMNSRVGGSRDSTQPVGKKKANELGLYDLNGNVFEWLWEERGERDRIYFGGSYLSDIAPILDSNNLGTAQSVQRNSSLGFRYARNLGGNPPITSSSPANSALPNNEDSATTHSSTYLQHISVNNRAIQRIWPENDIILTLQYDHESGNMRYFTFTVSKRLISTAEINNLPSETVVDYFNSRQLSVEEERIAYLKDIYPQYEKWKEIAEKEMPASFTKLFTAPKLGNGSLGEATAEMRRKYNITGDRVFAFQWKDKKADIVSVSDSNLGPMIDVFADRDSITEFMKWIGHAPNMEESLKAALRKNEQQQKSESDRANKIFN